MCISPLGRLDEKEATKNNEVQMKIGTGTNEVHRRGSRERWLDLQGTYVKYTYMRTSRRYENYGALLSRRYVASN